MSAVKCLHKKLYISKNMDCLLLFAVMFHSFNVLVYLFTIARKHNARFSSENVMMHCILKKLEYLLLLLLSLNPPRFHTPQFRLTPHFLHSTFSTLRAFFTSAFSTLRIFYTLRFLHSAFSTLCIFYTPHSRFSPSRNSPPASNCRFTPKLADIRSKPNVQLG